MAINRSRALGKGLNSLLPASLMGEDSEINITPETEVLNDSPYFLCPIDFITANPYQPRSEMELEPLQQLSASIKEKGILQPLVIRQLKENRYELIAGERRLRAAKMAGLEKVPVICKDIAISDRLELALIENIQRENLNAVEEAKAYDQLMSEFNLTQEDVSKRVGKNRSTVANSIRILQLPEDVLADISKGLISAGHGRVLLGLKDPDDIRRMRDEIIKHKLSVRDVENLLKSPKKRQPNLGKKNSTIPPAMPESFCQSLTNTLGNFLGSKAKIIQNGDRGKIEIEYYSPDDLERLLSIIHKN